jgi:hypothetical protein
MKKMAAGLFLALFVIALSPAHATTYYGGFEDTTGGSSDYDYNDLVFSVSGTNLVLNMGTGTSWYPETAADLNDSGTPFWNNNSYDSPSAHDNIGYCIYGGPSGSCGGHAAIDPTGDFLAASSSPSGSANNVTFSLPSGMTTATIILGITADTDELGWYNLSAPGTIFWFTSGTDNFTPTGTFGLAGCNDWTGSSCGDTPFRSVTSADISQFAFFGPAPVTTPEPGTFAMLGLGLLGLVGLMRRKALQN